MPARFSITPSQIPQGSYILAICQRPGCGGHRYLSRAVMIERAGDIPLNRIERRVRCVERKTPRGPACGGAMELEWGAVGYEQPEARGGWPRGKPPHEP